MCEPDTADPWIFVADFSPPPDTEPLREVRLTFTRSGEAWPVSDPGAAGVLALTRESDGQRRKFTLPTDATGELTLQIPEGTWTASFEATPGVALDDAKYPAVRRPAALVVAADGADEVDVAAWIVELRASLDGAELTTLPSGEAWVWSLWAPTGSAFVYVAAGASVRRRIALEPGPWDVTASLSGDTWPDGARTWEEAITEDDLNDRNLALFEATFQTVEVRGAVRIDGADAQASSRYVRWVGANGGEESFPVTTSAGASRYTGRVLADALYDVWLTSYAAPDGSFKVASAVAPGTRDARATVVPWSGRVTVNGAAPRGSVYSSDIVHTAADGSTSSLDVEGVGVAEFEGLAWDLPGETHVLGDGERLPGGIFLVESASRPRTNRTYDLEGVTVTVHATLDGRDVNQPSDVYYGSATLAQIDAATGEPLPDTAPVRGGATSSWVRPGPLVATALVPPGTYAISAYFPTNDLTPSGFPSMGTATVRRASTVDVDVRTWTATVELRADDEALPAVPDGNRGEIVLGNTRVTVPGTGRSRVQLRGFQREAPEALTWLCYASAGCGSTAYNPGYVWLWNTLLLTEP
jgi:hypothetical protein